MIANLVHMNTVEHLQFVHPSTLFLERQMVNTVQMVNA
jgi:hypothetical protein